MNPPESLKKPFLHKLRVLAELERPWFRKIFIAIWIIFFTFLIGVPVYIYTVSIDLFGMYGGMPNLKAVENHPNWRGSYFRAVSARKRLNFW